MAAVEFEYPEEYTERVKPHPDLSPEEKEQAEEAWKVYDDSLSEGELPPTEAEESTAEAEARYDENEPRGDELQEEGTFSTVS